jgi:hypothetical protein
MNIRLSVVIPTRNPNLARLHEVLRALACQEFPLEQYEVCVVDNGSDSAVQAVQILGLNVRVVREEASGLLWARLRGISSTSGPVIAFIDDDTVPDAHFVGTAARVMESDLELGTCGGKIHPRFLAAPPAWIDSVSWALALRDNGSDPLRWSADSGGEFPFWTPIGAGLIVRREAVVPDYIDHVKRHYQQILQISWKGQGCGGVEDKDLVLFTLRSGWATGYSPELILTHIIPPERLTEEYFGRLLPALGSMWMKTLHAHGLGERPPIPLWAVPLRKAKAWVSLRAWRSPRARLAWISACGKFDGLAANHSAVKVYPPPARRVRHPES